MQFCIPGLTLCVAAKWGAPVGTCTRLRPVYQAGLAAISTSRELLSQRREARSWLTDSCWVTKVGTVLLLSSPVPARTALGSSTPLCQSQMQDEGWAVGQFEGTPRPTMCLKERTDGKW